MTDVLTVSESEAKNWRMDTIAILDKIPATRDSRARVIDTMATKIQNLTSSCFETRYGMEDGGRLLDIIEEAAGLATELARQRASYILHVEAPGSRFDETTMMDALQSQDVRLLRNRSINCVAFPAVVKRDLGTASESQTLIIVKAQVIL